MKVLRFFQLALVAGLLFAGASVASAQAFDTQPPVADVSAPNEPYVVQPYSQSPPPATATPTPLTVQQQNAQTRGQQRQLRLASLAWYGMSNSRPTASPTPFSAMYSPAWQMPGGRPFAWYNWNRPTYLIYR